MMLTDDMCTELWGELEFAAMRRMTLASECRVFFQNASYLAAFPHPKLAFLDVHLGVLLGEFHVTWVLGTAYFAKHADIRWRQ